MLHCTLDFCVRYLQVIDNCENHELLTAQCVIMCVIDLLDRRLDLHWVDVVYSLWEIRLTHWHLDVVDVWHRFLKTEASWIQWNNCQHLDVKQGHCDFGNCRQDRGNHFVVGMHSYGSTSLGTGVNTPAGGLRLNNIFQAWWVHLTQPQSFIHSNLPRGVK